MTVDSTIAALQQAFPGDQVILPGTEQYEARNGSYQAKQESDLQPGCIFQPKRKEDVCEFIKIIKQFSGDGGLGFAIRAAGNMPAPGCANIQGGITLDLGLLDKVDFENGIASIEAGAYWGKVNETVQAAGLGVVGGRSSHGGIGGLALAGKSIRQCLKNLKSDLASLI